MIQGDRDHEPRPVAPCFFPFLLLLCTIFPFTAAATGTRYALEAGQNITWNQTLVSPGGTFVLGFFKPGNTSSGRLNGYLGIWYNDIPEKTVVWVANREQPLEDSGGVLSLADDGNISLVNSSGSSIWSTNVSGDANGAVAVLLDSGNCVLRRGNGKSLWESFGHPSDTFLPEMTLRYDEKTGIGQRLFAWRSSEDPSPGDFSAGLSSLEIVIWRREEIFWSNGAVAESFDFWSLKDGSAGTVPAVLDFSHVGSNFSITLGSIAGSSPLRWTLEPSGELKLVMWNKTLSKWDTMLSMPYCFCDVYRGCGTWGACDIIGEPPTCRCLQGFLPENRTQWEKNNFSGGCVRKAPLLFSEDDEFLLVEDTKLPGGFTLLESKTEANCRSECISSHNCTAYAYSNATMEPEDFVCLVWREDLADLQGPKNGGANLYIRMVEIEKEKIRKKRSYLPPLLFSIGSLAAGVGFLIVFFRLKQRGERRARERMMSEEAHNPGAFRRVKEFSDAPFVDFKTIKRCTCNFSDANKLGEGGFGSVYKGKLACGQELAVKRLSSGSKQGQREFVNEVKLIAKLQHKNLVRLLGWCLHKEEKILLYEYLPNSSLDRLIFGKPAELSWEKRFAIIEGVADGLLYLHHHSRMRVIHRDLKTSNILLDREMNPKISDFGLAKIIEIDQTQGNTNKVVGTFGYMSPEYAIEGVYSEKSDVFGFGVIMLEVIAGKRSTGHYPGTDSQNLLGHAWQLWKEGRVVELFEPRLEAPVSQEKALKFIHVAFLCIEETAADRPTMNSVVSMLGTANIRLPSPRQPGFSLGRKLSVRVGGSQRSSINGLMDTTLQAR